MNKHKIICLLTIEDPTLYSLSRFTQELAIIAQVNRRGMELELLNFEEEAYEYCREAGWKEPT